MREHGLFLNLRTKYSIVYDDDEIKDIYKALYIFVKKNRDTLNDLIDAFEF